MSPLRSTVAGSNIFHIFRACIETHVFFDVMFRDVISLHRSQNEVAIVDNQFGLAFDENTKRVGVKSNERKQSVHQNDDDAATECGKERRAAVDRAGEDGRENHHQDGVEAGLSGERPLMSEPDHDQGREKDDETSE